MKQSLGFALFLVLLTSCQSLRWANRASWTFVAAPAHGGQASHGFCGKTADTVVAFGGIKEESGSPFSSDVILFDTRTQQWQRPIPQAICCSIAT